MQESFLGFSLWTKFFSQHFPFHVFFLYLALHVPSNESKTIPAAVMTYLMYVLGGQTLFGDGGGRGRRGEGVGGDLWRNYY